MGRVGSREGACESVAARRERRRASASSTQRRCATRTAGGVGAATLRGGRSGEREAWEEGEARGEGRRRVGSRFEIVALERVLMVLGMPEVARFGATCSRWARAARSELVWAEFRLARFASYVYLPRSLREAAGRSSYEMCRAAVEDEARTVLSLDELCSFEWCFRFKRAAGDNWLAVDPYWCDSTPAIVRFRPGGSTAVESDAPGLLADLKIEWRWANSETGLPGSGSPCGRIRARVDGEDVPTYVASRHPRHKGFILESCWSLFTAFPMPSPREHDPYLDDLALAVGFEQQVAEALQYNAAQRSAHLDIDLVSFDAILRGESILLAALGHACAAPIFDDDDDDDDGLPAPEAADAAVAASPLT